MHAVQPMTWRIGAGTTMGPRCRPVRTAVAPPRMSISDSAPEIRDTEALASYEDADRRDDRVYLVCSVCGREEGMAHSVAAHGLCTMCLRAMGWTIGSEYERRIA
jgi:ribosomal protein S14